MSLSPKQMFDKYVKQGTKVYQEGIYDVDGDRIGEVETLYYASGYGIRKIMLDFNQESLTGQIVTYKKFKLN